MYNEDLICFFTVVWACCSGYNCMAAYALLTACLSIADDDDFGPCLV